MTPKRLAAAPHIAAHEKEETNACASEDSEVLNSSRFFAEWRWWLPVALLTLALALLFRDPFAGDWDSLDYAALALKGYPSPMLLGRSLFIFTNRLAYKIAHALFGLRPENAYLLFKFLVIAQSPLVVALCWKFARDLTASRRAATLAALIVALSPFFVIYSGQAMTEIPSLWLLFAALIVHLRGLRERKTWLVIAGAALLGLGVNVRELAALYGAWLVLAPYACGWRFKRREVLTTTLACSVFLIFALAPFAFFFVFDFGNYRQAWFGWLESSRFEQARHPVALGNFRFLLLYFFIVAPLPLISVPFAFHDEWRRNRFSPLFALACAGLLSNLILIIHYSAPLNGRYMLTGLPGLAPLAANYLLRLFKKALARGSTSNESAQRNESVAETVHIDKLASVIHENESVGRRAFMFAVALIASVAILVGGFTYRYARLTLSRHAITGEYLARLKTLPPDAVVMAGSQTISVTFWRAVGAGNWEIIGTGGGFPGAKLNDVIEDYLKQGRRVFLDCDPRLWSPYGWQLEETRAVAQLPQHFRFKYAGGTLYEIRPLNDATAHDAPPLQDLLNSNRIL